ncbi:acid stress response protein YqgB [Escherichia coli]|nr:acid stress response protein YqgB [Escherichia coli]EKQ6614940.1 acid stress response protein YqgB [Escherichia coli]
MKKKPVAQLEQNPCAYGLLSQFQAAIVVNCFTLNKII